MIHFKGLTCRISFLLIISFFSLLSIGSTGPGTIYIVIGSDTAIWEGMNTNRFKNIYNPALYINEVSNTRTVMDPEFRGQFRDSFGDTLSLTWWMMAGNIFRYAVNTDMPFPNIMTMYFMKEFHGDNVELLGDELSLHYHTFKWTDYNQDGQFWWNQTLNFTETLDDFNFTLAQLFLEEEVFPVSFRSGWHYMDNEWQNYLNKLLPYSLHNDYPNKRVDLTEPLDNTFDWSLAPSQFVPYNPSPGNYQVQGNSKAWNVRSIHLNSIKNNHNLLNSIFTKADSGLNQVVCIWGHLPETDFNTNIAAVDSILHHYQSLHPLVKFKYTTATEAMQLYRNSTDTSAPVLNIQEIIGSASVKYLISVNEPIFQEQPFVAYKDRNENFHVADCISTGLNSWEAVIPIPDLLLAKAGVVVSDTMGNQTYRIFRYVEDDIYVDNSSEAYNELYGSWTNNAAYSWGNNSRKAVIPETDSAEVDWNFTITQPGYHHISIQFPQVTNPAGGLQFSLNFGSQVIDTLFYNSAPPYKKWINLFTKDLQQGNYSLNLKIKGTGQGGKTAAADVIKVSPLVRDRSIQSLVEFINLGEVPDGDTISFVIDIRNNGIDNLNIYNISSANNLVSTTEILPLAINPMSTISIRMEMNNLLLGSYTDTIFISSDDPLTPSLAVPFSVSVVPYFVIVDNEDTGNYFEMTGTWAFSVAQAYGLTSRYAALNQNPGARAYFQKIVPKEGQYDIKFIVPVTVNAATRALYKLYINGLITDSLIIDQNLNSGSWCFIQRKILEANSVVRVEVSDPGGSAGSVLRADAIRIGIADSILITDEPGNLPQEYSLYQNYPNPFNPLTTIKYDIPAGYGNTKVQLIVYDITGRTVAVLVNEIKSPGTYQALFNAANLSSGVYFCRITAGNYSSAIKMMLIK